MKIDTDEKISKYFTLSEALYLPTWQIHCIPTEAQYIAIRQLAVKLDEVRELVGKPMVVHSWLRPHAYNKAIGSKATNSPHSYGKAADVHFEGMSCFEAKMILEKHLDELDLRMEDNGDESTWVHLDSNLVGPGGRFFKP